MGTLKRLSDYWTLGKRTYRELGIIAREILCLMDNTLAPAPEPRPPLDERFGEGAVDLNSLGLLPGPDFDFCAFFDSSITGAMEETRLLV
jgi:hypothetical protein